MSKTETHKRESWIKDIQLTSLGWDLALPIFLGVFIGYKLDQHFTEQYYFTLSLLVLGIVIGYYNLIRRIELEMLRTKAAKRKKEQDHSA